MSTNRNAASPLENRGVIGVSPIVQHRDGWTRLVLTPTPTSTTAVVPKRVYFALDRSGSMAGSPWKQVQAGVRYIVDHPDPTSAIRYVLYNDRAILKHDAGDVAETCADGGTNFSAALACILDDLRATPASALSRDNDIVIVFMTDGQDNQGTSSLASTMNQLKFYAHQLRGQGRCRDLVVHTIGFGSGVDATFLARLRTNVTTSSAQQGEHRTVMPSAAGTDGLDETFRQVFDFLALGDEVLDVVVDGVTRQATWSADRTYAEVFFESPTPPTAVKGYADVTMAEPDAFFDLCRARADLETTVATFDDVVELRRRIAAISEKGLTSLRRVEFRARRDLVLEELDPLLAMCRETAEAGAKDVSTISRWRRMSSATTADKFEKARHRRRAQERIVRALATAKARAEKFEPLFRRTTADDVRELDAIGTCPLTGAPFGEVFAEPPYEEFMSFMANVERPSSIDAMQMAPWTTRLVAIGGGGTMCSHTALVDAIAHALARRDESAVFGKAPGGGDDDTAEAAEAAAGRGFFKAADGASYNAAIPAALTQAHEDRVWLQLDQALGFLFCGDATQYSASCNIALLKLYGDALVARMADQSDFHAFAVADLRRLCLRVLPRAVKIMRDRARAPDTFPAGYTLPPTFDTDRVWVLATRHPMLRQPRWMVHPHLLLALHDLEGPDPDAEAQFWPVMFELACVWAARAWFSAHPTDRADDWLYRLVFDGRRNEEGDEDAASGRTIVPADLDAGVLERVTLPSRPPTTSDVAAQWNPAVVAEILARFNLPGIVTARVTSDADRAAALITALQWYKDGAEAVMAGTFGQGALPFIKRALDDYANMHRAKEHAATVALHADRILTAPTHAEQLRRLELMPGGCRRAGPVWDALVARIRAGDVAHAQDLLFVLFTGETRTGRRRILFAPAGTPDVPLPWTDADAETVAAARALYPDGAFRAEVERAMECDRTMVKHVYRASGKPNRHGHSNDNPWPGYVVRVKFVGFDF